jgi:2-hydroxychromene-2-carboxylate isomerase
MTRRTLEFWFDFASTYSYLTAMRIEAVTGRAGIEIAWKPFLLGPIFAAQGWTSSPFNLYPAKGRYMVRDIERIAEARGLAFKMPEPFPQNGLMAARLALVGLESVRPDQAWGARFITEVFRQEFAYGRSISETNVIGACLKAVETPVDNAVTRSTSPEVKSQLKSNTEAAQAHGIFGAPTLRTLDGELFWGDDRLEQAVAWAQHL